MKYVLVTGASRGIGKSTARLFARKGYHVFLNCNQSVSQLEEVKAQIEADGGSCSLTTGNVGNPDDVKHIFETIRKSCDALDVLVNNAGVAHIGLLIDMTDEEWAHVIQANFSSIWGTVGASCEAAYSASKSGVHGLTKALAKELAPGNIQVNALACGVIDTDMNRQLSEEERKELEYQIPAGRFGTPEETAQMVWDIANAPEYMTGQIIGIDGGF